MSNMSLPSRTTPSCREQDAGRNNTVQMQLAQWTEQERRLNRIREDVMIKFWAKGIPTWLAKEAARFAGAPDDQSRDKIMAVLSKPMTIDEISSLVDLNFSTVAKHLNRMRDEGRVISSPKERGKSGQQLPRKWSKVIKPAHAGAEANRAKSITVNEKILAALYRPRAAYEIAPEVGITRNTTSRKMRELAKAGLIVQEGITYHEVTGMPIKTWVRV